MDVAFRSFSHSDHRILTKFFSKMCSHRKADVEGWKQNDGNNSSKTFWWLKDVTEAKDAPTATQNYQ